MAARTRKKPMFRYGRLCSSSSRISFGSGSAGWTQNQMCFAPSRSGMRSRMKIGMTMPAVSLKRRSVVFHLAQALWFEDQRERADGQAQPIDEGDQVRG